MKPDEWPPAASDALHVAALAAQVEALKPSDQPWLKAEYTPRPRRNDVNRRKSCCSSAMPSPNAYRPERP